MNRFEKRLRAWEFEKCHRVWKFEKRLRAWKRERDTNAIGMAERSAVIIEYLENKIKGLNKREEPI
jgi:hypothetical protein